MREIRRDPEYVSDPSRRLRPAGRLPAGRASPESRRHFEFFVVRDRTVNAFAMPGGLSACTPASSRGADGVGFAGVSRTSWRTSCNALRASSRRRLRPPTCRCRVCAVGARRQLQPPGRAGGDRRGAGGAGGGLPQLQPRLRARSRPGRLPDPRGERLRHGGHAGVLRAAAESDPALREQRAGLRAHAPAHHRAHRRHAEPPGDHAVPAAAR
jgi:hypothetical protein